MVYRLFCRALVHLLLLAGCAAPDPVDAGGSEAIVNAAALPLFPNEAAKTKLGDVQLLGAWQLRSADRRFGGFSGLLVHDDQLLMLSDRGTLWSAPYPTSAKPTPPGRWQVGELRVAGRRPDAEALTIDGRGQLVMSLEGMHSLVRWKQPAASRDQSVELLPAALRGSPGNEGVEALATLPDGSLLAISESLQSAPSRFVAVQIPDPNRRSLTYATAPGFQPTGMDQRGGHLVVLERRLSLLNGFEARVTHIPLDGTGRLPSDLLASRELLRLGGSTIVDNFEGVAIEPDREPGSYRLWLVSDDNFHNLQRTLLLVFKWRP